MAGTISFLPSEGDYVAAMRLHFMRQLRARKFWVRLTSLLGAIALAFTLAQVAFGIPVAQALLIAALGALCGCIGLLIVVGGNFLLLPRRSRRLFGQQKSLHYETSFAWNEDGGRWSSERGETNTGWPDYHGWTKGRDTIALYLNDQFFQFLPLRTFSADAMEDLRATLMTAQVPR